MTYQELKLQAISLRARRDTLRQSFSVHQQELESLSRELDESREQRSLLITAADIMKQLIDIMSREQINQLSDLVTYGLQTIFTDHNYSLDIVVSESRSVKQASFVLVENLLDGTVRRSDFKDSIGGGVLAVVGLIIQVYYIMYYSQYPILFMDEALSQISSQYIPMVLEFINQLAEKKHFIFVLITHDERFMEYGSTVYSVKNGSVSLIS